MNSQPKLKPCAKCNSPNIERWVGGGKPFNGLSVFISCHNCGHRITRQSSEKEFIKKWNILERKSK